MALAEGQEGDQRPGCPRTCWLFDARTVAQATPRSARGFLQTFGYWFVCQIPRYII